jgi:hypothetical protein
LFESHFSHGLLEFLFSSIGFSGIFSGVLVVVVVVGAVFVVVFIIRAFVLFDFVLS